MPAYTNNKSIDAYYNAMKEPVKAQMTQVENDYAYNQKQLDKAKRENDAQAYRSLQRQLRTLPEEMSASGAQGGMVDSGLAFIKNRYLQGRNDRDAQLASDKAALQKDYTNTMTGLRGQLSAYEQQAKADRAELEYQNAKNGINNAGGYTVQSSSQPYQSTAQATLPESSSPLSLGKGPISGNSTKKLEDARFPISNLKNLG